MAFVVKEIFYTLQGEGLHTGRPAVFCRFSGCNLWSGRERDRENAKCRFCDTDFLGIGSTGGHFESAEELANVICSFFPDCHHPNYKPYVVFTGGEPALQITSGLLQILKQRGVESGVETNGTLLLPEGLDWITVSPKAGTDLVVTSGNELKLAWPQAISLSEMERLNFEHFYLQPIDGIDKTEATRKSVSACLENPVWKLSLQTHKFIGIP